MAKFKFVIYSHYVGADIEEEIEIEDAELEGMNEEEQDNYLNKAVREWMLQTVEYGWEKVEE